MRESDKFVCSNSECDHIDFTDGECPTCGGVMEKIRGDDYSGLGDNFDEEGDPQQMDASFDDDPDLWYRDGEESWA